MSGYENAPATRLLATRCCCCGRPLVDAASVEAGVGPDCRERYGYDVPTAPPDYDFLLSYLYAHQGAFDEELLAVDDYRTIANVLTRRTAAQGRCKDSLDAARAIAAAGYGTLAARIVERLEPIRIEATTWPSTGQPAFRVVTPYREDFVNALKTINPRRWDRETKAWLVGGTARKALWEALKACYSGWVGVGPQGDFVVP